LSFLLLFLKRNFIHCLYAHNHKWRLSITYWCWGPHETKSIGVCVGRPFVKVDQYEYLLSIDYICCKKLIKKAMWIFSKKIFEILIFYMKKIKK
jgi:hypothetical protein